MGYARKLRLMKKKNAMKMKMKMRKISKKYLYRKKRLDHDSDESDCDDSDYDDDYIDDHPRNFFFGGGEIFEKGNHIWFNTSVTKSTTNRLVRMIHHKNKDFQYNKLELVEEAELNPKPLFLHINSFGGDLLAVMAVIDAIQSSQIPVHTIVEGCAASAGTLMSVVGHKRLMTKNSFMLIHQLSSSMQGKMKEIEDDFQNNIVFMNRIKDIYMTNSSMTLKQINKALTHDLWWDAETCLEKGLIDEIVESVHQD